MKTFVRCGTLFTGAEDEPRRGEVLVFDEGGRLTFVGPEAAAPARGVGDRAIDHSGGFVMPGLIDVHTHLAYGNAKTEEDIDLYAPLEFRTLRGMFFAQKVAAAGYTAICSPGDAGQISLSIRALTDREQRESLKKLAAQQSARQATTLGDLLAEKLARKSSGSDGGGE